MSTFISDYSGTQIEAAIANALAGCSPKGTYADLAALAAAIPDGDTNIYLTLDNGYWNYWNGSAWTAGAAYTSSSSLAEKQDRTDLLDAETALDDADYMPFYDTSATANKKTLWSNIKSVLKTYFDSVYTSALFVITGYSKAETVAALAATDTINEALGKLEKNDDLKVDNTTTVNGHALSGNVTVTASDVGLGNVDNTSDADKPVSTDQAASIRDHTILDIYTPDILRKHIKAVTGYSSVSTPNNASGGVEAVLSGNTATNLITNGDFSNGTTGWIGNPYTSIATVDGYLVGTSIVNGSFMVQHSKSQHITTGKKYYVQFLAMSNVSKICGFRVGIGTGFTSYTFTPSSLLTRYSSIITGTSDVDNTLNFYINGAVVGDTLSVDNIMFIELTTAEESMTAAQLDLKYSNWFDGTKSTGPQRLVSVTRNSFDKDHANFLMGRLLSSNPSYTSSVAEIGAKIHYIRCNQNTTYTIQRILDSTFRVACYDTIPTNTGTYTQLIANDAGTEISINTDTATKYLAFCVIRSGMSNTESDMLDSIQAELGSSATPYVPYSESIAYVPAAGNSNDETADTINIITGVKTQNVDSGDYSTLSTPVITDVYIRGRKDFKLYPGGEVRAEPSLNGKATSSTTVITTSYRPIKSIRSVVRFDVSNGEVTETDVTSDASTSDNLSLTIANFDATKTYFYDCEYDTAFSTNPGIEANCEVDHGVISHDYGATATAWTLTANDGLATYLSCTNAGGAANIIAPSCDGKTYIIKNTSGYTLTVKTPTSTGVTIATAKTATVIYSGSDFIKISEV